MKVSDERGISFFETLARDVGYALRTFRRAPFVALTVVMTIALGLGVVTVAFTFFNAFFFQVDAVRNPDELFTVERLERPGSRNEVPFSRAEYEALRRETEVFTDVAAARPSFPTRIDGRAAVGMFVSGNFFDVLGVTATRGRTLTDDGHAGAAVRSARVLRRPGHHRRDLPGRRVPAGPACRAHRSDRDAAG
jgi:hypothetical protein